MNDRKPPIEISVIGTRAAAPPPTAAEKGNGKTEPLPKLVPIHSVKGEIVPPRQWIVPESDSGRDHFPSSRKRRRRQDALGAAIANGLRHGGRWIGLPVKGRTTLGFFTEDTERDLKERQAAINTIYGIEEAPPKMHLFPRLGLENELVVFDGSGKSQLTPFFHQLREAAFDLHAGLIVLDVLVDLFGGDEIRGRQVRAFMRPLLGLSGELPAATVLTSHVSQAGMKSDGGHSASTDWSNASRSRLYLNRPKDEEDAEIDTDVRLLARKKANYAAIGDTIKLRWQDGVFVPDEDAPSYFRRPVADVFLALMDEHYAANRDPISENTHASNYAPRAFARLPARKRDDYREADFKRAMETLFADRKIVSADYGRPGDFRKKIIRAVREG